ncbi:hypothetical protein [Streptomyces sp. NPDC007172]|uniref:hypothetical protein n=1 Tax=Streptomyces sp. NPDC007172 TaxID=3364776 RepID=UPI0036C245A1
MWLDLQAHPTAEDRRRAADRFRHKLEDMPGDLKKKLADLLPAAFLAEAEAELGAGARLPEVLDLTSTLRREAGVGAAAVAEKTGAGRQSRRREQTRAPLARL